MRYLIVLTNCRLDVIIKSLIVKRVQIVRLTNYISSWHLATCRDRHMAGRSSGGFAQESIAIININNSAIIGDFGLDQKHQRVLVLCSSRIK